MSHYGKGITPRQEGYTVKDGRLINDRKVNQIAEGIELAENKKKFRQLFF